MDVYDDLININDVRDAQLFERAPRRHFQRLDPFEFYDDTEFVERFRFTKTEMRRLEELIRQRVENLQVNRGNNITPMEQLLVTMRYLATGCFQRVTADFVGVSTSSANRIIIRICEIIASLHKDFISFPNTEEEIQATKQQFYGYCQFPGVVGSVDCTHIPIKNPGGELAEMYRNRKGYHSLNVQVVTDVNLKINNIVCRWPGSTHDSRIFDNSRLGTKFEDGEINGLLLGDAGYPCKWYLMTPFLDPQNGPERRYNYSHKKGRCTIERLFGVWKRRFPCLSRTIRMKPEKAVVIISCCAVLYNMLKLWGDTLEAVDDDDFQDRDQADLLPPPQGQQSNRGNERRRAIVIQHFA